MQAFEAAKCLLALLRTSVKRNLATKHPNRARRMLGWLNEWQLKVGADPMRPNPEFREGK